MIQEIINKIERICQDIVLSLANGKQPILKIPKSLCWKDVAYIPSKGLVNSNNIIRHTIISLSSKRFLRKFTSILKILSSIHECILNESNSTKRDLFYENIDLFKNQHYLDSIINQICSMLQFPRLCLRILASSKGLIAGNIVFRNVCEEEINCKANKFGTSIPQDAMYMDQIITTAKFILIIEKDATFQKLLNSKILEEYPDMLLVTGKGFPDLSTRQLLHILNNYFDVKIFALMDADIYGIEIMSVYKYGSLSLLNTADELTLPSLKWMGIHPTDIENFQIPDYVLQNMGKKDFKKAEGFLKRPYIAYEKHWAQEVEKLIKLGKKAEIQNIDSLYTNFLTDVYLPRKLKLATHL